MDHIQGQSSSLGVALSGGGVRASLFALGGLIYLVDSRQCERVTEISSVSGGSITNAFVAQRCDFQHVGRAEFDRHAAELVKGITTGLLSKRAVIALYGFLGLAVLVVTLFRNSLGVPTWLDVFLVTLFGVLALLRGTLLVHFLQRRLFGLPKLPNTLGGIKSVVNHVFCATDLNASMPVFFATSGRHFYSPAWGRAEAESAAKIRVADAVRASVAFPGGIPPKRLDVRQYGVSRTPLGKLLRWQQLVFRDARRPYVLYLADGGVWNNLGTDWFDSAMRSLVQTETEMDWHAPPQQLLVLDASAPTAAKPRLPGFRVPYIAEVLSLFRVWLVSYTSTLEARVGHLRSRAGEAGVARPNASASSMLVRIVDPVVRLGLSIGKLAWLGEPRHWSGRWGLFRALRYSLTPVRDPRGPVQAKKRWSAFTRQWTVRNFARLHECTAGVPTTLFAVPPEVAVQLLIHGYVSTAQAMVGSSEAALAEFPGVKRFADLVGLEAHPLPEIGVTVLGPISGWTKMKLLDFLLACVQDITDTSNWMAEHEDEVLEANDALLEEHRRLRKMLAEQDEPWRKQDEPDRIKRDFLEARFLCFQRKYPAAVQIYERVLSQVDTSDKAVGALDLAEYAYALVATGDVRASKVVLQAEEKLKKQIASSPDKETALAWYRTASVHGRLGDAEGAVIDLRSYLASAPPAMRQWLISEKGSKKDDFVRVRDNPTFTALENEVVGEPK